MLRTLAAGAAVAFIASRIIKMNGEGKLDGIKSRVREGVDRLRNREGLSLTPQRRPLPAPAQASSKARLSPSDDVSKPARAHPWPVDPRALPKET